jgi:hypothetical protein
MKKYFIKINVFLLGLVVLFTSCDLDINENPNSATEAVVTPDLTLPAVIAATLYNQTYYHGYQANAFLVGYQVPGGGLSGFGDVYTYNFTAAFNKDGWNRVFADLRDYQTIIRKSEENPRYAAYGAIAHIFKAFNYQLLVDNYGDVPYTEGVHGKTILSPKYDKDSEAYKLIVQELDEAIAILKANKDDATLVGLNASTDPVFAGNFTKWIQFANNLKLRLLIRAQGSEIDTFVQQAFSTFSAEGFLLEDALVNPGYNASAQENPFWAVYHSSVDGTITQSARFYLPSKYVLTFYNGKKLTDEIRRRFVYANVNIDSLSWQLGDEATDRPNSPNYIWHTGTGIGKNASDANGILKSRAAGAPIFLASEIHFLLAEAALTGHALNGDVKSNFEKGIEASFSYLSKAGTSLGLPEGFNPEQRTKEYIETNASSYLANIDLAATTAQKLEAIITQKYISFNILNSNEAWAEFRRTGYPTISGTAPETTFLSVRSQSTRADKLPVRFIYPQEESDLNKNTPAIKDAYSNSIFWDKN